MKILFLCGVFPKENENSIYKKSKGIIQTAANKLQWNIIEGIEKVLKKSVSIITSLFIGSYPKMYTDVYIRSFVFTHDGISKDHAAGFINLKGIEVFHRMVTLRKPINNWVRDCIAENERPVIITYSVLPQFMYSIKRIKHKYPEAHICIVVPDLFEYMTVNVKKTLTRKIYNKFVKGILLKIINNGIKHADSFVLLTEQMRDALKVNGRPYVIVEGITSETADDDSYATTSDPGIYRIVYTGTLACKYGIMDLVRQFMNMKDERYKLIICGEGDSREEIERLTQIDTRISYKGNLRHDEVLRMHKQATVLVNPRRNDEEFTKFSFPSKTVEYMRSGRPVMMHRLDGIPREYDEYINYFDLYPGKNMFEAIAEFCNRDSNELNLIGEAARNFVLKNKNPEKQARKIIAMICQSMDIKI